MLLSPRDLRVIQSDHNLSVPPAESHAMCGIHRKSEQRALVTRWQPSVQLIQDQLLLGHLQMLT